eukprot:CAMPEP_0204823036 /NCGR_PEP_ID=MMETSP1346-20131115/1202_1 /ASSEMBLY_ACC=CAM_ASM_000771 /TAXON_ID=215587 /ORGANISM="Aplanochytrium stocchinoi, Strain GSBS06" /LENGTH=403 /DNA_ID=CAMNT_0051949565 /DNA_START=227 /DNA_END=1435 /DNA_ORIENTATION=+
MERNLQAGGGEVHGGHGQGQAWQPGESWIVLDDSRSNSSSPVHVTGTSRVNKSNSFDANANCKSEGETNQKTKAETHPDSVWFEDNDSNSSSDEEFMPKPKKLEIDKFFFDEDDTYEAEGTLRLTPALGLQEDNMLQYNSMAQAERTLGLTVSLDGIDSEFIKKSSQTIMEKAYIEAYRSKLRDQQSSPYSKSSTSSADSNLLNEEDQIHIQQPEKKNKENDVAQQKENDQKKREKEISTPKINTPSPYCSLDKDKDKDKDKEQKDKHKYGGRAPPILGALAPPVPNPKSSPKQTQVSDVTGDSVHIRKQLESLKVDVCKKVDIMVPFSKGENIGKIPCSVNELYPSCASSSSTTCSVSNSKTPSCKSEEKKRRVRRKKVEKGTKRSDKNSKKAKKTGISYTW